MEQLRLFFLIKEIKMKIEGTSTATDKNLFNFLCVHVAVYTRVCRGFVMAAKRFCLFLLLLLCLFCL